MPRRPEERGEEAAVIHAFRFRLLVLPLGEDQPVYGLQYPGLDGQTAPLTRIDEMAAEFIRHMRQVQPGGPYYLCGYSFGGLVAYEIAQQLTAQGQPVAMVAFFDTLAPGLSARSARPEKKMERSDNHRDAGSSLLNWLERVHRANKQAEDCYLPQPYSGKAILFRAGETPDETSESSEAVIHPLNGWGEWVRGGLEVHDVPGDHNTILSKRNIRVLGEKLRVCLLEAQSHQLLVR
ncbi:MAG: hypothetical protein DMD91_05650 [Candidatus Rokuibacteriota bacterium]|nr:MAG: hypothetical protein DMD91_05650 [Candidatus Rokubacteria bacterium]